MNEPLPPEMAAKLDAWIAAIRNLARQHQVAHHTNIARAAKDLRLAHTKPSVAPLVLKSSFEMVAEAGVPRDELSAIRTLIFG